MNDVDAYIKNICVNYACNCFEYIVEAVQNLELALVQYCTCGVVSVDVLLIVLLPVA